MLPNIPCLAHKLLEAKIFLIIVTNLPYFKLGSLKKVQLLLSKLSDFLEGHTVNGECRPQIQVM